MTNELVEQRPCCGGEARITSRYIGYGSIGLGGHDLYAVICRSCEMKSGEHRIKEESISAWNTRAENVRLRAELDASVEDLCKTREYLERKCRHERSAVKCIYDIETYLELGSGKFIKRTIDEWRGTKEEADHE